MIWQICFAVSLTICLAALAAAVVLTKKEYKRKQILNPFHVLFGGVTISCIALFIPFYTQIFQEEEFSILKIVLLSFHNTLRLFIVDSDFSMITETLVSVEEGLAAGYSLLAAILFVVAPLMTFGFVLSFFKNVSAYKNFIFGYSSDAYIFSELNEKSIELARDIKKNNKKNLIVFTDVYVNNEESSYELAEQAKEIGSVAFKKDITVVNFGIHNPKKQLNFFIIGEDDDENVKQTLLLGTRYCERDNVSLYVFSTSTNSELLLNNAQTGKIRIRRVNMVQSLINRTLYDEGKKIFESAVDTGQEEKQISAVIIGMGLHGTEMTKALSWFCQMDGYRLEMNVYDRALNAESRFRSLCPELMDETHNHDFQTKGEAHYGINIHEGVDVDTKEFWDSLDKLETITYAFIALGDDEMNIRTAVKLRTLLEKKGMKAKIDAVVYNSDKKEALSGITNYSSQPYDINFIGDIRSSYSKNVVLNSELEEIALGRHLRWGQEVEFWKYEYNYRSSIASAIHRKLKVECKISGADKPVKERTEAEKWALRELEHRRWNAYIRSEGFTYAPVRNNLAKTHHCLVPFDQLPLKEQEKDDD